jgi:predicted negative regulator of RcsB-dependent stress response
VDRLTRKELKTDRFAQEVGHTVEYVGEHRQQFVRYGAIALVVVVIAAGIYFFLRHQANERREQLSRAMLIMASPVGEGTTNPFGAVYKTEEDRNQAYAGAMQQIVNDSPNSREGVIAKFYLAGQRAREDKLDEAVRLMTDVANSGKDEYASLAKLSLAKLLNQQGKTQEAEKQLRDLINSPTAFVSKEKATIALAELIAPTRPDEARKLLEPLRESRATVSRAAMNALAGLRQ